MEDKTHTHTAIARKTTTMVGVLATMLTRLAKKQSCYCAVNSWALNPRQAWTKGGSILLQWALNQLLLASRLPVATLANCTMANFEKKIQTFSYSNQHYQFTQIDQSRNWFIVVKEQQIVVYMYCTRLKLIAPLIGVHQSRVHNQAASQNIIRDSSFFYRH